MKNLDVIIVGAGITGLSAANALVRAGRDVMVLEAADRPGGRMVRLTRNGDCADAGPQVIHSSYRELLGLIAQLDLGTHLKPFQHRVQYLDRTGAPRISYSQTDTARIMGFRGAVDLLMFYFRYFKLARRVSEFEVTRDIPQYDNISALQATEWAGPQFRDYVLRPMMYAMTNSQPEYINLYHMIGTLKLRMTTVGYGLPTGVLGIAERLAQRLPVKYGMAVQSLIHEKGEIKGVLLANGTAVKARHVIVACEIGSAAQMVPDDLAPAKEFLRTFKHTPLPLVYFFMDRPVPCESSAYMGHPYREAAFNMAVNHAQRAPWLVPSGKGIVSAWPAYPRSAQIIKETDSDIIRMALTDVEAFIPGIANWIDEARVVRHAWGIGRQEPGFHRKTLEFKAYAEGLHGVSFAGNDYDSVNMEGAVRSALRAVERALKG